MVSEEVVAEMLLSYETLMNLPMAVQDYLNDIGINVNTENSDVSVAMTDEQILQFQVLLGGEN